MEKSQPPAQLVEPAMRAYSIARLRASHAARLAWVSTAINVVGYLTIAAILLWVWRYKWGNRMTDTEKNQLEMRRHAYVMHMIREGQRRDSEKRAGLGLITGLPLFSDELLSVPNAL